MLPPTAFDLFGLGCLAALAWLVWDSLRAREAAVAFCRGACRARGWQLLDDTVAIESVRLARDRNGRLKLRRRYGFEYDDTGNTRARGGIVMIGAEIELLHIGGHSTLFDPGPDS